MTTTPCAPTEASRRVDPSRRRSRPSGRRARCCLRRCGGAWCRVKAVLSAMDGLLQAEEEAQVLPSHSVEIGIWLPQAAGDISGCEEPEN